MIRIKSCSVAVALFAASAQACPAASAPVDEASAWVLRFVDAIADPALRAENADAVITDIQRFIPLRSDGDRPGCHSLLALGEHPPPFVLGATLSLLSTPEGVCGQERLSLLHVTLKTPSPGRDIVAASQRLTELFGKPVAGAKGHNYETHWQISPLVAIVVGVSDRPSEEGVFSITVAQAPAGRRFPLPGL